MKAVEYALLIVLVAILAFVVAQAANAVIGTAFNRSQVAFETVKVRR